MSESEFKMVRRTPETAQADVDAAYAAGYARARADAAAVCRAREQKNAGDEWRQDEDAKCAEAIERLTAPAGVDSGAPEKL